MTHSPSSAQSDLKPCPFCGGKAESYFVTGVDFCWKVACTECGASRTDASLGRGSEDMRCKARAIEKWNRRAAASANTIGEDAANVAIGEREAFERALAELVNKIDTGLDSGDLLADAKRASAAIDSILSGGDLIACAHEYFRDSGDRYEKSVEFRIGWNACLDAIGVARAALTAEKVAGQEPVKDAATAQSEPVAFNETELSPCPFCGGKPMECGAAHPMGTWVQCESCGARSQQYDRWDKTFAHWNRRAAPQPSQPAQSGGQDDEPLWDHKGNVRHEAVDRLGEKRRAASTQPVQTERALTEVGFIVHDDLHGWHFAPTVAWTYLGKGRSLYAMTAAQPASSLAEGGERE